MLSDRKTKGQKLVGANNWTKWKWQMNMNFEQYDMMSIIDGMRKCPNITNTEKFRKMMKEICWLGSRIMHGQRRDRECVELSGCGFGIDVQ